MTKSKKTARQRKEKNPDLDIIWDDLMSSAPLRNHEVPGVIQTSILGLDFRAEVEYEVHVDDDDEDNDDDDDNTDNDENNGRYSLPRLSLSYPVQLTVYIGQTVTNNATISAHASTWFHESGFYTKDAVIYSAC